MTDTAQQRADSERLKAHELLKRIVGIVPMTPEQRCARIDWLVEYAQQARREALEEALREARKYRDIGDRYTSSNRIVVALDRALDRLREGR